MRGGGVVNKASFSLISESPASAQSGEDDGELLRVCSEFEVVDAELDRLTDLDTDPPETELMALHRRWSLACRSCSTLDAHTSKGRRAKAKVLLSVIQVALGGNLEGASLHELLALSLAQDLIMRGPIT